MHFRGNAALWLQTFQAMHTIDSWAALYVAVFAKFNRNKYTKTIDAFFAFKQNDSVDEYAHKFEELMHGVLLYNPSYDETFFVNHFLKGLKPIFVELLNCSNLELLIWFFPWLKCRRLCWRRIYLHR